MKRFSFDLSYYDMNPSNIDKIYVTTTIVAVGIAVVLSLLLLPIRNKLIFLKCNGKVNYKGYIKLVVMYIAIIMISQVWWIILGYNDIALFFAFITPTTSILLLSFYNTPKKCMKKQMVLVITFVSIFVFVLIGIVLNEVASQKNEFSIIVEQINDEEKYYAVISQGKERFSAYECGISYDSDELKITIDTTKHKYFSLDSVTTEEVHFDIVDYIQGKSNIKTISGE